MAGEITLWNPAMRVSRLFLGQIRLFESELALASGFGPMEADECQVNLAVFEPFAQSLAADRTLRHHQVWLTLAEGFVVTVLAIAERADLLNLWPQPADKLEVELRERARSLSRAFPH
jgi:Family of unknown function (DUF6086)